MTTINNNTNFVMDNNNQEANEMKEQKNNVMEGLINIAVVSRKDKAVVFYDVEGNEGFHVSGSTYGGSVQLGHMVLVHNELQLINKGAKKPYIVNIQLTNNAKNLLSGRRPDKLDKLDNWANLDTRKQENWKAVSRALANQIRMIQANGGNVVFTAGTGERTFRHAWKELNEVAPKAPVANNKTNKINNDEMPF